MAEQLSLPPAGLGPRSAPMSAIVQAVLEKQPLRVVRFDDLVQWVRIVEPEADICEIDVAARRFERGSPGALTYGCPCEGEADDPGPHITGCRWADPSYTEGTPL